jgi:hypothetical protein
VGLLWLGEQFLEEKMFIRKWQLITQQHALYFSRDIRSSNSAMASDALAGLKPPEIAGNKTTC